MNIEKIRENKYNIDAFRFDDMFFWVDFVDDYKEEVFCCFTIDDGYKIDRDFTFKELAESENTIFYGLCNLEK